MGGDVPEPWRPRTWVEEVRGGVHTGDGDQFNIYDFRAAGERTRRRGPIELDAATDDDVRWQFVEPPGWDELTKQAGNSGLTLLRGARGSGRRMAARRLLGLREARLRPIRVLPATPEFDQDRVLDTDDVGNDDRLLLDCGELTHDAFRRLQQQLVSFRHVVNQRQAMLVVVLPARAEETMETELLSAVRTIQRPDGLAVLGRHLRLHGAVAGPEVDLGARARAEAVRRSMEELARLAWVVATLRQAAADRPLHACIDDAIDAASQHDDSVVRQFSTVSDMRGRALLLSAAVFAGRDLVVVHEASEALLRAVGSPQDDIHELARPHPSTRLNDLQASVTNGVIDFHNAGYDSAVRRHFWRYSPGLRSTFADWVIESRSLLQADPEPGEIVERFVAECFRVERPGDVVRAVHQWAPTATSTLAVAALRSGLTHERYAAMFRRQCYDWATTRDLEPDLALLVVAACQQMIAPIRPRQAVVRLNHLLRHSHPAVSAAASAALVELSADRQILRHILSLRPRTSDLDAVDRRLFLDTADPRTLISRRAGPWLVDDPEVRARLVRAWRDILWKEPLPVYERRLRDWLELSGSDGHASPLVDLLVDATGGKTRPASGLFAVTQRWATQDHTGPDRRPTAQRLNHLLDEARSAAREKTTEGTGT